jgi:hypothetical protein
MDIKVEHHGSLYLLRPENETAEFWLNVHTDEENRQWFGGALVVEPRYVADIVEGAREAGLLVN